jgi:hypothetical protein
MDDGLSDQETGNGDFRHRRGPLAPLGRIVADSVGELNFLRVLPVLAAHLKAIRRYTEHMDDEVTGMHASVVRMEGEIRLLREDISGLEQRIGRLEPYLEDVNRAVRPFRRARARLPGRHPAHDVDEQAPPDQASAAG